MITYKRTLFFYVITAIGANFGFTFLPVSIAAENHHYDLRHVQIDLADEAALQRGAKVYMNYCSGCHSLKYMRYNRMAKDIDITTLDGIVDEALLKQNLIFDKHAKVSTEILSSLPKEDAQVWFGLPITDLSLVARSRGVDWIYTYLHSFYQDKTHIPWGTNNLLYHNVAMPNVLERLQGVRVLQSRDGEEASAGQMAAHQPLIQLAQLTPGELNPAEFDQTVTDVVTFLAYVAEPNKLKRQRIGWWVLGFLLIFSISAYLTKREYWKDVK